MLLVAQQVPGQHARAAAEVADPAGTGLGEHGEDGLAALDGERLRAVFPRDLRWDLLRGLLGDRVVEFLGLGVVGFGQPGQGGAGEPLLVRQVAAGDELLLRVPGQPVAAGPDQLVDLLGGHPVVLGVVEHGQQHVQVVERVGQPELAGQPQAEVRGVTPLARREGAALGVDGPAEGPEDALRERAAAPAAQGRDVQFQREGFGGQGGTRVAAAGERGAEGLLDRHREQAGGGVRPVVDVLAERGARALAVADEADRVDLEQQRGGTSPWRGLGIEDVRLTSRDGERLGPVRVLVQQEPQVGRWRAGGGDGQEHTALCPAGSAQIKIISAERAWLTALAPQTCAVASLALKPRSTAPVVASRPRRTLRRISRRRAPCRPVTSTSR